MPSDNRDYLEMSFRSIHCFTNDGTLDVNELQSLVDIAKRDGVVDDNEKRVLRNIFSRLKAEELSPEMIEKIQQIREDAGI